MGGTMCSQKSETPILLDARTRKLYASTGPVTVYDPMKIVPKTTYKLDDVIMNNPYDYKDEMYHFL